MLRNQQNLWVLTAVFVLLGATSWYLLRRDPHGTEKITAERAFAVERVEDIRQIVLNNPVGDSIFLEKTGDAWLVNGRYKAFPNAVTNLLQTLTSVRMQSIPPKSYIKTIFEGMRGSGIRVMLFDKNSRILKDYIVGGSTLREDGNFFLMDGSRQPYIVGIPNFVGNVRERYDLSLNDWRDRSVIDVDPERIESFSIEYPYHPEHSFGMIKKENRFFVHDPVQGGSEGGPLSEKRVRDFLESLPDAGAEGIQNNNPNREKIVALSPYCRIAIREAGKNQALELSFYPIATDTSGNAVIAENHGQLPDTTFFRLHAQRSDGDFLLVQYPVVRHLFVRKTDFVRDLDQGVQ
ncbi:MAG: hypothetical protein JPMHGGIA_02426 [Saprospiraceae bacterium]|nr:hypothetical protein [Saprospiraceae bacterium]